MCGLCASQTTTTRTATKTTAAVSASKCSNQLDCKNGGIWDVSYMLFYFCKIGYPIKFLSN